MTCNCPRDWRLELLDLATGERLGWLPFTGFTFEELLNQPGSATITVPVRKVTMRDVWPHLRAVAFTRTSGPGATASAPVCEFIGMIESVNAESGGTLTIGLQSIEKYLAYRIITGNQTYTTQRQTIIAEELVTLAAGSGIPLTGVGNPAAGITRSRSYLAEDDKVILDAITELTEIDDGPDYRREYTFSGGAWSTLLRFADYIGDTTPRPLRDRRGLTAYGLTVDATMQANWVRGRGQEIVNTDDTYTTSPYPRFDLAVQWSDVADATQLAENVDGYLLNHYDPTAVPDVTIADLKVSTAFALGDLAALRMNHGAIQFDGTARVIGKAWSVGPEQPTMCTFSFTPPIEGAMAAIVAVPPSPTLPGCC